MIFETLFFYFRHPATYIFWSSNGPQPCFQLNNIQTCDPYSIDITYKQWLLHKDIIDLLMSTKNQIKKTRKQNKKTNSQDKKTRKQNKKIQKATRNSKLQLQSSSLDSSQSSRNLVYSQSPSFFPQDAEHKPLFDHLRLKKINYQDDHEEKGVSFERKKQNQPGRIKVAFGKVAKKPRLIQIVPHSLVYEYWLKQWNMTEPVIKVQYPLRSQKRARQPDYSNLYENYDQFFDDLKRILEE